MAEDIIIEIAGIEGECKVAGHVGKIELSSWSFSVSNPGSYQQGGGGSTGKSMAGDLNCTKNLDKSSPNLVSYCASSKHVATVVLVQRKQAGDGAVIDFIKLTLTDCIISNYNISASGGLPMDSFSINFAKLEYKFKLQDENQAEGAEVTAGWNWGTNTLA